MNTVVSGDIVYIKGGTIYAETPNIDTACLGNSIIQFIGYTDIITDGGLAIIDGESVRLSGLTTSLTAANYLFKNIRFTNHTSHGADIGVSGDRISFENCEFTNNGGFGLTGDDNINIFRCTFSNNTSGGLDADYAITVIGSTFGNNAGSAACSISSGIISLCTFFENSGINIDFNIDEALRTVVAINNTIDGANVDGTTGINFTGYGSAILNNIIYDCNTGINGSASYTNLAISSHNLLNSNNTDRVNFPTGNNNQTDNPDFVDSDTDNYNLNTTSPARKNALGGGDTGSTDIGAWQSTDITVVRTSSKIPSIG